MDEEQWRRVGFTVVGAESDKLLLLFASDRELTHFREQVDAYQAGQKSRANQKRPDHSWLEAIDPDGIAPLGPEDRTGILLRQLMESGLDPHVMYRLDVELWYLGTRDQCDDRLHELGQFLQQREGRVADSYIRDGLCMARVQIPGRSIPELLTVTSISAVELPPRASYGIAEVAMTGLDNLEGVRPPDSGSPRVCVLDSGIARGHPLLRSAVGETIAVPKTLGDGLDVSGHGSHVAGIALYGDVEAHRRRGQFVQNVWIDAAQLTNANNEFDDEKLILSQMREAITYFAERGCRVFNLSLGDVRLPYQGGKPSAWAATLDNLARELDVVIVVSAGNYKYAPSGAQSSVDCLRDYPRFLLESSARIIEPATAANVLTVGAVAGEGEPQWSQRYPGDVPPRPVARPGQPSPFTRSGFGVRGAIKPELVDYGGNLSFDGRNDRMIRDLGLAVVSLNWRFTEGRLFAFDHGTSFAAPRVAHIAARVLAAYPDASANLVRALLVHSAEPPSGLDRLPISEEDCLRLCGYGQPDENQAIYSSDNRVVMIAENEIPLDSFHVYEVPIPAIFAQTRGERRIAVTLAFDPPVRHRRAEYLGSGMSFRLVRGCSLDQVVRVFKAPPHGAKKGSLGSRERCELLPGATHRDEGTVQHGVWTVRRSRALEDAETLYLVVRNERRWQPPSDPPQHYAVVVSLEHRSQWIDLYNTVKQRVHVTNRARIRLV